MSKTILVIADSHGHLGFISDILRIELSKVNIVVHLGDSWFDMKPFISQIRSSEKEVFLVRGNVDEMRGDPNTAFINETDFIQVENKKILLTHGHVFGVKDSLEKLKVFALSSNASIVFFGHTHQPTVKVIDNILFFNPGAVKDGIYGIFTVSDSGLSYKHYKLKNIPT